MNKLYYNVNAEVLISDPESGKIKKKKEPILVQALSPTEAIAKATAEYGEEPVEFEIVGSTKSPIVRVIE